MKKIRIFEAFAGIGSQHLALKNLWYDVDVVWLSEWYIDAITWYWINYLNLKPRKINKLNVIKELEKYSFSNDSKKQLKSLKRIPSDKLSIIHEVVKKYGNLDINFLKWDCFIWKNVDLFTYSFPCQDISQQWNKKWFKKWLETRSWLLWEVERVLKEIKKLDANSLPKVLIMENVKSIVSTKFISDLNIWIDELKKLWYNSTKPFLVNAKDVGSPQNRERIFLVSFLGKQPKEFNLSTTDNSWIIWDIFCKNIEHKKFKTDKKIDIIHSNWKEKWIKKWILEWYSSFNTEKYFYYLDGKCCTITASWANSRIKIFDGKELVYLNGYEHLKLQWFYNKKFYKNLISLWLSENKIKFLAWNSINVKVLEKIFNFYLK